MCYKKGVCMILARYPLFRSMLLVCILQFVIGFSEPAIKDGDDLYNIDRDEKTSEHDKLYLYTKGAVCAFCNMGVQKALKYDSNIEEFNLDSKNFNCIEVMFKTNDDRSIVDYGQYKTLIEKAGSSFDYLVHMFRDENNHHVHIFYNDDGLLQLPFEYYSHLMKNQTTKNITREIKIINKTPRVEQFIKDIN